MAKLFISHSTEDDGFVRALKDWLAYLKLDVWIDSRELRGGDLLRPAVQKAIDDAEAYAVLVSPNGLQSKWVGKELKYALALQEQLGADQFRSFHCRWMTQSLAYWKSF